MEIAFDKEKHEYSNNDMIIPGVTTILADVGIIDYSPFCTTARGSRMHKIMELFLIGKLDYSAINEEETKMIEWLGRFLDKYDLIETEKRIYNSIYNYAGTFDLLVKNQELMIIADLKTGHKIEEWHKIQLAAYCKAQSVECGILLYERQQRDIMVDKKELDKFFRIFKAALDVYNFKRS